MSIICSSCNEPVRSPDSLWWAATGWSPEPAYFCGICQGLIDPAKKAKATHIRLFTITIGPVIADISRSTGNFQHTNSVRSPAQWYVHQDAIRTAVPMPELLLNKLYPYWCIATLIEELVLDFRKGGSSENSAHYHCITAMIRDHYDVIKCWIDRQGEDDELEKDEMAVCTPTEKVSDARVRKLLGEMGDFTTIVNGCRD